MKSGFYRVDIDNNKLYNGYFSVRYRYQINNESFSISKTSLDDLEKTILKEGLPWKIISKERAKKTREFNNVFLDIKNKDVSFIEEYQKELSLLTLDFLRKKKILQEKYNKQKLINNISIDRKRMDLINNFIEEMNQLDDV